jgi:hypothetical protein
MTFYNENMTSLLISNASPEYIQVRGLDFLDIKYNLIPSNICPFWKMK